MLHGLYFFNFIKSLIVKVRLVIFNIFKIDIEGEYHDELKLSDRAFKCSCGFCEDRDIHAAKNTVWMFNHNVGVEHTKFTRMEMKALVDQIISNQTSQLLSEKYEAAGPLGPR